jgi:hypothetical protein
MSKIRRETPTKPPRKGAGGGDVRVKKEKISKECMNVEKTRVEQKERCPNMETREVACTEDKTPPLAEGGGEIPPPAVGVEGGGMIRKASEDPPEQRERGGLMSVTNRIDKCKYVNIKYISFTGFFFLSNIY